jgi:hypothetical protein
MSDHVEFFNRGLPKWPQFLITGQSVSVEQAKDIILKTDSFFHPTTWGGGGNNKHWNEWAYKELGYDALTNLDKELVARGVTQKSHIFDLCDDVAKALEQVDTTYLSNSWASCSYIFGPHGWCSPEGNICFVDNIGKWPSVEEVYKDLLAIHWAFPYVRLTGTLMDREQCEDFKRPVVTFRILESGVVMTDDHEAHHFDVKTPSRDDAMMMARILRGMEQGLPNEWITEYGQITKPIVQRLIKEFWGKYPTGNPMSDVIF